jgi:hypothetical protein
VSELDRYLDFVAGRCRPKTVLATAYDLKVFFTVVGKSPAQVSTSDVLGFITAQRHGGLGRLQPVGDGQGVSDRSVRRRLSTCRGCSRFCMPVVTCRSTRCRVACRRGGRSLGRGRAWR